MGLFDLTESVLEKALAGSALRQQAIANNIANVNTPGFRRSDTDFQGALAEALEVETDADSIARLDVQPKLDSSPALRADGNNVDFDQEVASLNRNAVEYEALIAVAHGRFQTLQSVIGR